MKDVLGALRGGGVLVIPTDTVYGLACLPQLHDAVRSVFALKGRSEDKPLPVLGDGIDALEAVASFDDRALELARRFWPGPLTLVLPERPASPTTSVVMTPRPLRSACRRTR